jgi:hypothetical protein
MNKLIFILFIFSYKLVLCQSNTYLYIGNNSLLFNKVNSNFYELYSNTHSNNYYSNGNYKSKYNSYKYATTDQFGIGKSKKNSEWCVGIIIESIGNKSAGYYNNYNFETGPRTYDTAYINFYSKVKATNFGFFYSAERRFSVGVFYYSFGLQSNTVYQKSIENKNINMIDEQKNGVFTKHNALTSYQSPCEINFNNYATAKINYPYKKFEFSIALLYGLDISYLFGQSIYNTYQTDVASGLIYDAYSETTKTNFLMASFNYLPQISIKYYFNKKS